MGNLYSAVGEAPCNLIKEKHATNKYTQINGMKHFIVQELCESRGGRPGLSVLTSLPVSVDVKNY